MSKEAIEKIKQELKAAGKLNPKAAAIKKSVADALICFCKQDEEFSQAIIDSDKTLADCLKHISNGIGNSISDLEVYNKAVEFYFSGATVKFHMTIDLCGEVRKEVETSAQNKPKTNIIDLNFDDLFGGI